jgi:hypothetical protein
MSRTIFASALATLVLATALAPSAASAKGGDGSSRRDREATALWPSQRPYHVDTGPVCNSVPVLVRSYGPGPAYVWVTNKGCD